MVPPEQLDQIITDDVATVLTELGRTEDVAVGPDGRRMALVGFESNQIAIVGFELIGNAPIGPTAVRLDSIVTLTSAGLSKPHGLAFLDDSRLVVANRESELLLLELDDLPRAGSVEVVSTVLVGADAEVPVESPGSVVVRTGHAGIADIVVCNNFVNTLTRYAIDLADPTGARLVDAEPLLTAGLDIPDGVAISESGDWLAVSDHATNQVLLYVLDEGLPTDASPAGALSGVNFPHGMRFVDGDSHLIVADAGLPYVHVYGADEKGWYERRTPTRSVRVMSDETFHAGRLNLQEGGPKGLALTAAHDVAIVTCAEQPLAFFRVADLIGHPAHVPKRSADPARLSTVRLARRLRQANHELWAASVARREAQREHERTEFERARTIERLSEELKAAGAAADLLRAEQLQVERRLVDAEALSRQRRSELDAVRSSTAWRITAPLRNAKDRLGTLRRTHRAKR